MTMTKNTVTKNVTSFAHEAAITAGELGGQAVELGRTAADIGIDAASNVASAVASNVATAANHLAHSLSSRSLPVLPKRRSRAPWMIAGGLTIAVALAVLIAKRKKPADKPVADAETASEHRAPHVAMAS